MRQPDAYSKALIYSTRLTVTIWDDERLTSHIQIL